MCIVFLWSGPACFRPPHQLAGVVDGLDPGEHKFQAEQGRRVLVSARRRQRRHELVYDTADSSNSQGFPYPPTQRLKGNARQLATVSRPAMTS
jgi:hypothetical protein